MQSQLHVRRLVVDVLLPVLQAMGGADQLDQASGPAADTRGAATAGNGRPGARLAGVGHEAGYEPGAGPSSAVAAMAQAMLQQCALHASCTLLALDCLPQVASLLQAGAGAPDGAHSALQPQEASAQQPGFGLNKNNSVAASSSEADASVAIRPGQGQGQLGAALAEYMTAAHSSLAQGVFPRYAASSWAFSAEVHHILTHRSPFNSLSRLCGCLCTP